MVRLKRLATLLIALVLTAIISALVYCTVMPGASRAAPLPPLTSVERDVSVELRRHVTALAVDIGERRATAGDSLAKAERYLQRELSTLGVGKLRRELIPTSPAEAANLVLDLAGTEA